MLLAAMACALIVGAFLLIFVRGWQGRRMAERYRAQAVAAFQRHDYAEALGKAGSYLKKRPTDADQLLIYARAREQVQEPDRFSNLRDASDFLRRYLVQKPDDAGVRMDLLKLYNRAGYFAEAAEAASKMRPSNLEQATAADLPVLEQEALALVSQRSFTDPRVAALLDRIAALDPLNVQGNFLRLRVIVDTHPEQTRAADARAFANSVLDAHPDDPRALLLSGAAGAATLDARSIEAAVRQLRLAAGLDPTNGRRTGPARYTDVETARRLLDMSDALHDFDMSLEVLKDAERFDDPELKRALVRRLWQDGDWAGVERVTAKLDATQPDSDPELAGFRALALRSLGREDDARAIAAALKARKGDYRVTAWTKALPIRFERDKPALDLMRDLKEVVKGDSNEPVFMVWLGDALLQVGRSDEAREYWKSAADAEKVPEGRSWPLPYVRIAETLLLDGRVDEAVVAATHAMAMSPNRGQVAVVYFETQAARIQRGTPGDPGPAKLLAMLREVKEKLAGLDGDSIRDFSERLIVPEVIFLVAQDQKQEATQCIREALGSGRQLRQQTVQRLASVSAAEHLGVDAEILATVKADESSANLRFQQALDLAFRGKVDEGQNLLDDALRAAPTEVGNWIALGRFLDRAGPGHEEQAARVWKDLAAKFPDDLSAQRACLASPSLAREPDILEQVITRYQAKTGADPGAEDALTRIARARSMLVSDPSARDRDRAIALLGSVVSSQPSLAEPKVLLARALLMDDPAKGIAADVPRAIVHLTDALTLEPRSIEVALELGRLLGIQGQYAKAKEKLDPIARDSDIPPEVRFAAVRMLLAQGDSSDAPIRALEEIAAKLGEGTPAPMLVTLAEAYQSRGRAAESAAIYNRLAAGKADDADSIYRTARYFAAHGDAEMAESLRKKLDTVKADPGVRELVKARLALERDDRAGADAAYEAAVAAAPQNAQVWIQYAGSYLLGGKPEGYGKALEIAGRGLRAIPGQVDLLAFQSTAEALQNGKSVKLLPLVQSLGFGNPDARRILALARDALARGDLNSVDGLRKLIARAPNSVALQMFVAQRLASLDPAAAAALVNSSLAASPTDPAPARMACNIFLSLERWGDLLQAARAWRQRDTSQSAEPDLAIARAQLGLQQPAAALATLEPRFAAAVAAPDTAASMDVLNLYCRALVHSGKDARALQVLTPLFKTSQQARVLLGLGIAGHDLESVDRARAWIDAVRAAAPPDSINDQLAVAMTYAVLADRLVTEPKPLLDQAEEILKTLTQSEGATAQIWECLGIVRSRRGDNPGAEEAYRRAIALDPASVNALNNLANIEAESNGRLQEALALAQRASAAQPNNPDVIDTLAGVQYQLGRQARTDGNAKEAEARFRESLAGYRRLSALQSNRDPGLLKKAANAALDAGDSIQAAELFDLLLLAPGLSPQETALVQNNLASLLVEINRGRADLDRARTLLDAAMRTRPDTPEFYDTLGWLESARGRFGDAEAAFRKSLALSETASSPPVAASRIGLATLLAGSPEAAQRDEAARLLGAVDEKAIDPALRPKLDRARQLLTPR
jgi:tetratricopeptide (TPR) repeat protein